MASPAASLTACSSSSAASSPVTIGPDSLPTGIDIVFWEEERINVLQLTVGTETIARRIDNSYVNGTKMMNLCGLTRGRRDSALKNIREREVVLKGPRNLKGVWIPLDKAHALADRFNLTQVASLLERDLVHHPALDDPLTLRQPRQPRPTNLHHSHPLSAKRRAAQHLHLQPNPHPYHPSAFTPTHHYQHHRPAPLHLAHHHQSPLALGVGLHSHPATSAAPTAQTPTTYAATPALSTASPGSTACTSPNLDGSFSGPLPTPQVSSWPAPIPTASDTSDTEAAWANGSQGYFAIPPAASAAPMATPVHQGSWGGWQYPTPTPASWPPVYATPAPVPFTGFQPQYFSGYAPPPATDSWASSSAWSHQEPLQQGYWPQKPMPQAQAPAQVDLGGEGLGALGLLLDA